MIVKIELIKAEIERRKSLADKQINNLYFLARSDAYAELLNFINYLEEELVSEDLEDASKRYALNNTPWDDCADEIQEAFKEGAQWKKEKFINKACGWLKENWNKYVWFDHDNTIHFGHWENDFHKYMEE